MFIITEALPITKQVKLIRRKKFAAAAFSLNEEIFVVYVMAYSSDPDIYQFYRAIEILYTYADFANIFSSELATKLSEHTRINDHSIDLVES